MGFPAAGCLLVAAAVLVLYDQGLPNYDLAYALSWGAQIASGHAPSYGVPLPPTPHPLTNLAGVLLSPFGAGATAGATLIGALAFGALGALAYAIGRELAGTLAGVAAAVLVVTRDSLLFWGSLDYLDIPYCALGLGAILAELRGGSRREGVVLALLAVAGLLRPEAWLLSGAYLVWVCWRDGRRLPSAGLIALTAAAPVLWVASDLVTTGRPLYSFTLTRELTGTFKRVSGPGAIPIELPRTIGRLTRPGVVLGAVAGVVLALRSNRDGALRLLGLTAAGLAATVLVVAAGTPLNARYLFLAPVIACVFCGVAIAQLASSWRPARVAGALVLLGVLIGLVLDAHRIADGRRVVAEQRRALAELHAFADRAAAGCPRGSRPQPRGALSERVARRARPALPRARREHPAGAGDHADARSRVAIVRRDQPRRPAWRRPLAQRAAGGGRALLGAAARLLRRAHGGEDGRCTARRPDRAPC